MVGVPESDRVGDVDGDRLGRVEGTSVGFTEGATDGKDDAMVRAAVVLTTSATVGDIEGALEGDSVGE